MSHAVATIQFVLHSFKQSTASLTKDRVLKMKSVLLSIVFIALLLVSLGPDGSDCIDTPGKRSEVNSNRQKVKNSLEIFWYPYDRTSKVLLASRCIIIKKSQIYCCNHALIYIVCFLPEKSDQLSTKFVRSCTEIGLLPGDGAERRLRANRKQAQSS